MKTYEYRFNIPVLDKNKDEIIARTILFFELLQKDYPELAPHWFKARSKKKARPYSPAELEREFDRKYVVGLFSSMNENESCGITLQYMPEINGCFVVSMSVKADMDDPSNSERYMEFSMSAVRMLEPINSFVRIFPQIY